VKALFKEPPGQRLPVREPIETIPLSQVIDCLGRHYFADCLVVPKQLHAEALKNTLISAIKTIGATLLAVDVSCCQKTGEISVMAMISESHFCVHYFPGSSTLIFDGHTCGSHIDPEKGYTEFAKLLSEGQHAQLSVVNARFAQRDIVVDMPGPHFCPGMASLQGNHPDSFLAFLKNDTAHTEPVYHPIYQMVGGLYQCDTAILADVNQMVNILHAVTAHFTQGHTIQVSQHVFDPPGVSAVLSGTRVHATVHTWPFYGLISCDIMYIAENLHYVDEAEKRMRSALQTLATLSSSGSIATNYLVRGIPVTVLDGLKTQSELSS
jgi:S-adenosylmethionine/arginine decarboxylase-like enzyme